MLARVVYLTLYVKNRKETSGICCTGGNSQACLFVCRDDGKSYETKGARACFCEA